MSFNLSNEKCIGLFHPGFIRSQLYLTLSDSDEAIIISNLN